MERYGHIFISYSSKEAAVAAKVCDYLEASGIRCWIAPRNIDAGGNYASQIVSAIKTCEILVVLASENTNASGHVSNEVSIAFDNRKVIIPFKLQDFNFTDEYLYFLGRKHWIEAYEDLPGAMRTLKETILSLSTAFQPEKEPTPAVEQMPPSPPSPEQAPEAADYTRETIVDLLIEKSGKYPYNIYEKICTPEGKARVRACADQMFRETVKTYRHSKRVAEGESPVDLIVRELLEQEGAMIQVQGMPGSAKNMILQLAFYELLERFRAGETNVLPFYISASYYEKIPYNPQSVHEQMHDILSKEFCAYFSFLRANPAVRPVLMIEAIREHNVAKIAPENVIFELWREQGRFSRVCAMDVGLIKNRSRLKRVIPITGDTKGYVFLTSPVPIDDQAAVMALIESVFGIYGYDLLPESTYSVLKELKFPTVDIFLVRLIAKEMLSMCGQEEISLTEVYEKLALSELYGDTERLAVVAEELYDYVFDPSYIFSASEYNAAMWSLPHKHGTFLDFLIAYYFVRRIEDYQSHDEQRFFGTMLTAMANRFMTSFMKDNYALQETMLHFITENYEVFDVQQKSNAAYWLGRISYKNLVMEALTLLTKEFTKYKPIVKTNNKNTQENCDRHFLFRAICTGMLSQGQANMMDEYLCVVVNNDIANAINRGATIEYFGDNYQMVAHDTYYLDTDLSAGEQAIRILNSRIERALLGDAGGFVENDLVTMLTLLQARMQNPRLTLKFDIRPYIQKALEFLRVYQGRPQNIVSSKLQYYFKSVEEDFSIYMQGGVFDIGPMIYNRYRSLRQVKRHQWVSHQIEDPESVSEHAYSAWLMAMFFLPEEHHSEGYCKREILDMLLIHDMAEAVSGAQVTQAPGARDTLADRNDVLRKLFLKGSYPDVANLTYYYNIWTGYYNGLNTNARTARDINLLQSVYTFCEYYCMYPEHFTLAEVGQWLDEKHKLRTELGYQLFDRLITNNLDFASVMEAAKRG